jgi:hypothetical protein
LEELHIKTTPHGKGFRIYIPANMADKFGTPTLVTVKYDLVFANGKRTRTITLLND